MYFKRLMVCILCVYMAELSAMEDVLKILQEHADFSSTSESHYSDSLSSPPQLLNIEIPYNLCNDGILVASFNVGQGAFFLVKNAKDCRIAVVDCGSANNTWGNFFMTVGNDVASFINGSIISACIVTHPDNDHYNYLPCLLEEFKEDVADKLALIVGGAHHKKAKKLMKYVDEVFRGGRCRCICH